MFYDDKIMKRKTLRKVWMAGNYQTDSEGDEISLPKICEELDEWMGSEHGDARRRLSLRTSAVFIHGAAEVYKKKMQQLLKDVDKIDKNIIFRNRRLSDVESGSGSSETGTELSSTDSPEQMLLHSGSGPNISNVGKRVRRKESPLKTAEIQHSLSSCTESTSIIETGVVGGEVASDRRNTDENILSQRTSESGSLKRRTSAGGSLKRRPSEFGSLQRRKNGGGSLPHRTSGDRSLEQRTREGGSSQQCTGDGHSRHSCRDSLALNSPPEVPGQYQKKDQAVQTVLSHLSHRSKEERNISEGFDETLPFGCVLIYDNVNARIPSQIMFSSINLT